MLEAETEWVVDDPRASSCNFLFLNFVTGKRSLFLAVYNSRTKYDTEKEVHLKQLFALSRDYEIVPRFLPPKIFGFVYSHAR